MRRCVGVKTGRHISGENLLIVKNSRKQRTEMWWMADFKVSNCGIVLLSAQVPLTFFLREHVPLKTHTWKCCNSLLYPMKQRTRRQEWGWKPFMSPWEDVYFSKLLLTCSHAVAQSKQRYSIGERKQGNRQGGDWRGSWEGRAIYGWWMRGRKGCRLSDVPFISTAFLIRRSRQSWMRGWNEGQRWREVMGGTIGENVRLTSILPSWDWKQLWENESSFLPPTFVPACFLYPRQHPICWHPHLFVPLHWLILIFSFSSTWKETVSLILTEQTMNMPFVSLRMVSKLKAVF